MRRWIILAYPLSQLGYYFLGDGDLLQWALLYTLQFGLLIFTYRDKTVELKWIIAVAVISRALLLPTEPLYENDHYRYLWEGHLVNLGGNPFESPPDSPEFTTVKSTALENVGFPHLTSVYGPAGQALFAINHYLFGESLWGIKFFLMLFDLGTAYFLWKLIVLKKRPQRLLTLYLLNPLVLKEVAQSAHVDSLLSFSIVAFAYCLIKKQTVRAFAAICLGFATKFFPIILAPFLLKNLRSKDLLGLIAVGGVTALSFLPFLWRVENPLNALTAFSKEWIFNAGFYQLISSTALLPDSIIRWAVFAAVTGFSVFAYLAYFKNGKDEFITIPISSLLIFSPVINPWYLLWTLPLAIVYHHFEWFALSYFAWMAYTWYEWPEHAWVWRSLEHGVFWILMLYRLIDKKRKPN